MCPPMRSRRSAMAALVTVVTCAAALAGCKPKLHESMVLEKVQQSLGRGGTFSAGGCYGLCAPFTVQIRELSPDYTGVVHVKGACAECDEEMRFELEPVDPPPGHRARGRSDLDPARWSLRLISTKPPKPVDPALQSQRERDDRQYQERLEQARKMMREERRAPMRSRLCGTEGTRKLSSWKMNWRTPRSW